MTITAGTFKGLLPWTMLTLAILMQGCLTIEENYTFKKDGSGKMEYVVDMSEMAELLKGFPGAKDNKDDGMDKMELKDKVRQLGQVPGVKKVKLKQQKDGFIQRLSFQFADLSSLNKALNVLMPDSTAGPYEFFRWEGNTLVGATCDRGKGLSNGMGGGEEDTTDVSGMLKMMHYKFDMRFAETLSDVQVAEGVVKEPDGAKRMKLSTDWSVLSADPNALDMRITLTK